MSGVVIPLGQNMSLGPPDREIRLSIARVLKGDKGEKGDPGAGVVSVSGIAGETIARGSPLCVGRVDGKLYVSRADTPARSVVVGLAAADALAGSAVSAVQGVVQSSGLVPGLSYFLAATGGLTTAPPTAAGQSLVEIGIATSATEIVVAPRQPILL